MQTFPLPKLPGFISLKLILAGLFLLFLIFFVLNNYLNIIPLGNLFTKLVKPSPKITVNCPVSNFYCQKAKPIVFQGKKLGMGFILPPGTIINNVFSGTLENGLEEKGLKLKPHPIFLIKESEVTEKNQVKLTARYSVFGVPLASPSANTIPYLSQNSPIASAAAESFPNTPPFNGVNFIFSILKDNNPVEFEFK